MRLFDFIKDFFNPKEKYGGEIVAVQMMKELYILELAFYTAISYIASAISKCEIKTYENNKEVKNKEYFTLNVSANINQTSSEFWHKVVEKMFYEEAALVIESGGKLYCADSYTVLEERPFLGHKYGSIVIDNLALDRTYSASEVYVFRLENAEIKKLVNGFYKSYSEVLSYAMTSFKKSNALKYKLKINGVKAGDKDFNEEFEGVIKAQLKTFLESDAAVYPEFDGYDLEDISPKSNIKDSKDIRELKKDIFETVAQAVKIPLSLMLGNITNMQEVVKTFITFAVDPIAETIGEELTRKDGFEAWKKGNYAIVDTSTINHIDPLEVADKVDKLISSGTMCIDEVREQIGKQPIDDDFSKTHWITKNYDTIENRLKGGDNNE